MASVAFGSSSPPSRDNALMANLVEGSRSWHGYLADSLSFWSISCASSSPNSNSAAIALLGRSLLDGPTVLSVSCVLRTLVSGNKAAYIMDILLQNCDAWWHSSCYVCWEIWNCLFEILARSKPCLLKAQHIWGLVDEPHTSHLCWSGVHPA